MDGGAWQATVHGAAKTRTGLHFSLLRSESAVEKNSLASYPRDLIQVNTVRRLPVSSLDTLEYWPPSLESELLLLPQFDFLGNMHASIL